MTLQGLIWARTGGFVSSIDVLRQAIVVAKAAGATSNAALAALTLIEEHGAQRLPEEEVVDLYLRAEELLKDTQDAEDRARLHACAHVIIKRVAGLRLAERNFSLPGTPHNIEARFIEKALGETGGSITRAAKMLSIPRQSLANLLKTRHRKLLGKRTPAKKRKRSMIRKAEED